MGFKPTQLGVALLMTYNCLEIDITRPTIRGQNEKDFQKIVDGVLNRNEVRKKFIPLN